MKGEKSHIDRNALETTSLIFIPKLHTKLQKGTYSKQGTSSLVCSFSSPIGITVS